MKTTLKVLATTPLIVSSIALADENVHDRYGYIGGHASYYTFYDNNVTGKTDGLDDTPFYGGQVGWRFHPNWSVQGWYEQIEGDAESKYNSGRRLDMTNYYASGRYHFDDHGLLGFEPYAGINVGEQIIESLNNPASDDNDELMTGVELGLQRVFFRHVVLDLGTRQAYSQDREYWEGQVYAGINLAFGISNDDDSQSNDEVVAATPAEVVTGDTDGDGVSDDVDKCSDTASGAVVDENGCQVYETRLQENRAGTIYFPFDSDRVQGEFDDEVRTAAERMKAGEKASIRVEGHTDNVGSEAYNQGLSERRAQSVRDKLVTDFGIDGASVSTQGYGESRPADDNSTEEGRANNRRADVIVESQEETAQFK